MAAYVLNEELKRAVVQVVNQHLNSFQPRPKRGRRLIRRGGGDSDGSGDGKFAIVIEPAGASTHGSTGVGGGTVGKCQLLDADLQKIPPGDGESLADVLIEFKSIHKIPIPMDRIIRLYSDDAIQPGSVFGDGLGRVWGQMVDAVDELWEQPNRGPGRVLWLPESATQPKDLRFDSVECQS